MTDEKRILLICTAGITSGLLVKNIQTAADEQNIPIRVYSAPAIIAEQAIQNQHIDGLMIEYSKKGREKFFSILFMYTSYLFRLFNQSVETSIAALVALL